MVIWIPKLDKKIEIESSPEKIYNIVADGIITPKWNPMINAVERDEEKRFKLDTDIGPMTVINSELKENESITWFMEKSDMNSFGYILTPKKDATEVVAWAEFSDKKLAKILKKSTESVLEGLKIFTEYIEKGGKPSSYNKWEVLTTP